MIRVLVEMWPKGDESKRYTLGEGFITNVGGDMINGNYKVQLMKSPVYAKSEGVWKRGAVEGFPRKRLGPWDLLLRALRSTVGDRNP